MEITQTTVVGTGVLYDCVTRDGQQFRVLAARPGGRELFAYDAVEPDLAVATIVLEEDEADQLADLLHSRSLADRIAEIERRVAVLARSGR